MLSRDVQRRHCSHVCVDVSGLPSEFGFQCREQWCSELHLRERLHRECRRRMRSMCCRELQGCERISGVPAVSGRDVQQRCCSDVCVGVPAVPSWDVQRRRCSHVCVDVSGLPSELGFQCREQWCSELHVHERLHRECRRWMQSLCCGKLQGREWIGGMSAVPSRDVQRRRCSHVCVDVSGLPSELGFQCREQ